MANKVSSALTASKKELSSIVSNLLAEQQKLNEHIEALEQRNVGVPAATSAPLIAAIDSHDRTIKNLRAAMETHKQELLKVIARLGKIEEKQEKERRKMKELETRMQAIEVALPDVSKENSFKRKFAWQIDNVIVGIISEVMLAVKNILRFLKCCGIDIWNGICSQFKSRDQMYGKSSGGCMKMIIEMAVLMFFLILIAVIFGYLFNSVDLPTLQQQSATAGNR